MRISAIVVVLYVLLAPDAFGDVRLHGDLVIKESIIGSEIIGEVINDTEETVTLVSVQIALKDASDEELAKPLTYVKGFSDPERGTTSLIPPGRYVPFRTYVSGVMPEEIDSYEITISYTTTEVVTYDTSDVTLGSDVLITSISGGIYFRGELTNNTSSYIYDVGVTFAVHDGDGVIQGYSFQEVAGGDVLDEDSAYQTTLIQPGESAPFEALVLCDDPGAVTEYYKIITYEVGTEGSYDYFGIDDVVIEGDITVEEFAGDVSYLGAIANGTGRDIYNVTITFVSRNGDGKIIDLYDDTVDGTSYEMPGGGTTSAHIAPGESATFRVDTFVTYGDMATYEYVINYQYDLSQTAVTEAAPVPFTLGQNFPNPFNPATTIPFTLPGDMPVTLHIYNMAGQLIDEPVNASLAAGAHDIRWDASRFPSGVYIYSLTAGGATVRRKMTLIR